MQAKQRQEEATAKRISMEQTSAQLRAERLALLSPNPKPAERLPAQELEPIRSLVYAGEQSPFYRYSDQPFSTLSKLVGRIIEAVSQNVVQPLSAELVREIGTDYQQAVEWFWESQNVNVFLIRYGDVILCFDKAKLSPMLIQLLTLLTMQKYEPIPVEVRRWLNQNPEAFPQLFPTDVARQAFPVCLGADMYIFDRERGMSPLVNCTCLPGGDSIPMPLGIANQIIQ